MAFKKGHKKTGGRKTGSINKNTIHAKEAIIDIINSQMSSVKKSLEKLKTEDYKMYLQTIIKFFPYVVARKHDITSDGKGITKIEIELKKIDNSKSNN